MKLSYNIEGSDFTNAGRASSNIKRNLKMLNIPAKTIKKIVVALYEAEVNIVAHAFKGVIDAEITQDKIVITITDRGPGIPNIDKAMQEGFSTATKKVREMGFGAGMGLPNIKRNVDDFTISSVVDEGTTIQLTNYFNL